jgi:hypothetical protein
MESGDFDDPLSGARLERWFEQRLASWRELLAAEPLHAREALRALMPAERPITFLPEPSGYLLRGATRLGALLFDEIPTPAQITRAKMASPRGFEPRLPP